MKAALILLVIMIGLSSTTFTQTPTKPAQTLSGPNQQCGPDAILSGDLGYTGTECHGCSMTGKHIEGEPDIEFASEPVLTGITKGGPADGKLAEGDLLVAINGEPITSRAGATHLSWLTPGESVRLTVRRNGAALDVEIVAGARCRRVNRNTQQTLADIIARRRAQVSNSESRAWVGIGVQLKNSPKDLPEVIYVAPQSPAAKAGIKTGDTIVAVDGVSIKSLGGSTPFRELRRDQLITLLLMRDGEPVSVTLTATGRP